MICILAKKFAHCNSPIRDRSLSVSDRDFDNMNGAWGKYVLKSNKEKEKEELGLICEIMDSHPTQI